MYSKPMIKVENLSKAFQLYAKPSDRLKQFLTLGRVSYHRTLWALQDINICVEKGQVLGIIGNNGAGKSTLLQLLAGTLQPSSGKLECNGRIAALLELGAGFNPEFTGRENIQLSAALYGLSSREIALKMDEIIDFSGVRPFIDQPVKTYSSGMYVRLAFSVATSVNPEILIIDEALSVGDGAFSKKSFDRILELKSSGATILFCSHALYQVESFSDQVIWLEHGHIKMSGNPHSVVNAYIQSLQPAEPLSTLDESLAKPSDCYDNYRIRSVKHTLQLDSEPQLCVDIEFDSDSTKQPPHVGIVLNFGTHLPIASFSTFTDQFPVTLSPEGAGKIRLQVPRLFLRKGEFTISVYLLSQDAIHVYDKAESTEVFVLEDNCPNPGILSLDHHWAC